MQPCPLAVLPSLQTWRSVATLRRVLDDEGIDQPRLGGRQHYLRWETPTTARLWEDNGLDYDSTLSYADRPGFRCGTCFEYPMFDAERQEQVNLKIRPLIAMECSIIDDKYMGLGFSCKSRDTFENLKKRCKLVEGKFTLLWHNSYFKEISDFIDSIDPKKLYSKILR